MSWHVEIPEIAEEVHFGDRRVRCFTGRPRGVDRMLREAVARNGSGDAVVSGDVRVSYAGLDAIVSRVAANLSALGVVQGDRVALLLSNRPEFIHVLLGAARIGAIAVPVNVREQTPELTYILNHCGAKALVHDASVADRLPAPDDLPAMEYRFSVGGEAEGARAFQELLTEPAAPVPEVVPDEEDVAVILYTSGTTGLPKGAMLTQFNICHSAMHFETCMALTKADRSVLAVPASHVTGLIANILTMVRVAGCNLILPEFDARAFLDFAVSERMTYSILVPAMYNLCLLRADFSAFDLSPWRIGGYGGAPMPEATIAALADKLPDLILMNAYGSTEVTSPATLMPMGETALRPDSVGRTVPCGEIRIVDEEGRDVPRGQPGEIWIGGPMTVPGYWNDEARDGGRVRGRVLEVRRCRFHGRRRLCPASRPQEGHDHPRWLQRLQRGVGERVEPSSRRHRMRRRRPSRSGAGREDPRLRPGGLGRCDRRRSPRLLRRTAGGLQGAGLRHLPGGTPAAQCQRQGIEEHAAGTGGGRMRCPCRARA